MMVEDASHSFLLLYLKTKTEHLNTSHLTISLLPARASNSWLHCWLRKLFLSTSSDAIWTNHVQVLCV